jgi:hypothetical protein
MTYGHGWNLEDSLRPSIGEVALANQQAQGPRREGKTDARWYTVASGRRTVYLSEHPALALICCPPLKETETFLRYLSAHEVSATDRVSKDVHARE